MDGIGYEEIFVKKKRIKDECVVCMHMCDEVKFRNGGEHLYGMPDSQIWT